MTLKNLFAGALAGTLVLTGVAMAAQTTATGAPKVLSGSVKISSTQIAFLVSGKAGGGTLEYKGKSYEFNLGGLGVGGIGVQTIEAAGSVYNLEDVSKFPGTYVEARAGATLGNASKGAMSLSNEHGVILELKMRGKGVALSAGADGVIISMK